MGEDRECMMRKEAEDAHGSLPALRGDIVVIAGLQARLEHLEMGVISNIA